MPAFVRHYREQFVTPTVMPAQAGIHSPRLNSCLIPCRRPHSGHNLKIQPEFARKIIDNFLDSFQNSHWGVHI